MRYLLLIVAAVWMAMAITAAYVPQSVPEWFAVEELGHWMRVENGVVANYQCVVPTTWNCTPRDDAGTPGPMEQALVGTPVADPDNPIESVRVVPFGR